jgi:hypothetical protein
MTDQPEPVDLSALEAERDAALERVRELTEWRPMESCATGRRCDLAP